MSVKRLRMHPAHTRARGGAGGEIGCEEAGVAVTGRQVAAPGGAGRAERQHDGPHDGEVVVQAARLVEVPAPGQDFKSQESRVKISRFQESRAEPDWGVCACECRTHWQPRHSARLVVAEGRGSNAPRLHGDLQTRGAHAERHAVHVDALLDLRRRAAGGRQACDESDLARH